MTDEITRLEHEYEHACAIAASSIGQSDRADNVAYREQTRKKLTAARARHALNLHQYWVCDEHVDERRNNEEHIYHYEAPDLLAALTLHKEAVGTQPVAVFDRAQKTIGFRQWA